MSSLITTPTTTFRSVPTNTLILVLPSNLFSPRLLSLFKAHFSTSYGSIVRWTPLEGLGRVFLVYESEHEAAEAKREMDGFVWEEEDDDDRSTSSTSSIV